MHIIYRLNNFCIMITFETQGAYYAQLRIVHEIMCYFRYYEFINRHFCKTQIDLNICWTIHAWRYICALSMRGECMCLNSMGQLESGDIFVQMISSLTCINKTMHIGTNHSKLQPIRKQECLFWCVNKESWGRCPILRKPWLKQINKTALTYTKYLNILYKLDTPLC